MTQLSIHEKYLHALSQTSDLMTVAEWAEKVGQVYPDLLDKANQQAEKQKNDTTGLREIAARISSLIASGKYTNDIEIDTSEKPRKVRYLEQSEKEQHSQQDLEDDVAPLKRIDLIKQAQNKFTPSEAYRVSEFENISKQLKQFFGLDFEVDHAKALLNPTEPGTHHPDNLQLLVKAHNAKKNSQNWPRFTLDKQIDYIKSAIHMQSLVAEQFEVVMEESVLDSLLTRLSSIY